MSKWDDLIAGFADPRPYIEHAAVGLPDATLDRIAPKRIDVYEIKDMRAPIDDYAQRVTLDLSRKKVEVDNAVFLKLGGSVDQGGLVAKVRHEHGPSMNNMGRTVFIGKDGKALATVTVKMRDDGSAIDIVPEVCL